MILYGLPNAQGRGLFKNFPKTLKAQVGIKYSTIFPLSQLSFFLENRRQVGFSDLLGYFLEGFSRFYIQQFIDEL